MELGSRNVHLFMMTTILMISLVQSQRRGRTRLYRTRKLALNSGSLTTGSTSRITFRVTDISGKVIRKSMKAEWFPSCISSIRPPHQSPPWSFRILDFGPLGPIPASRSRGITALCRTSSGGALVGFSRSSISRGVSPSNTCLRSQVTRWSISLPYSSAFHAPPAVTAAWDFCSSVRIAQTPSWKRDSEQSSGRHSAIAEWNCGNISGSPVNASSASGSSQGSIFGSRLTTSSKLVSRYSRSRSTDSSSSQGFTWLMISKNSSESTNPCPSKSHIWNNAHVARALRLPSVSS
mmetsp:Transcript_90468/g.156738  ORF Transcript_90468/g.156738 Transcript_90468/m.156738 type:complete len:292 (-) Transcript_90468:4344-5219(-)